MSNRRHLVVCAALLTLSLSAVAKAAEQLKPGEVRQNLFSTCFVSDQDFWIVGELGRVFHTKDGGQTFERHDVGTRNAILAVACLPGGSVVVVGQHGLVSRSRDAGATWEKLVSGTDRNLLSVDFVDDSVGIAVGDFGTILRTQDGGTSWAAVELPTTLPLPEDIAEIIDPGDVLLYEAEMLKSGRGWIVGEFGVALTTSDGGATWTAQPSGVDTTLFGVAFVDENRGWAVGLEQVMLHTKDGGATWQKQDVPARSGFVLALYDVAVAGQVGWAIGDSGFLLRSKDAGESWERVDLPIQLAANWLRGIELTPTGTGFIVGADGLMMSLQGEQYRELKQRS